MYGVPPLGDYIAALRVVLQSDCVRFARRVRGLPGRDHISRATLSRPLGSESPTRGIYEYDWWPARVETAGQLEKAWRDHPEWNPRVVLDLKVLDGPHGFVLRRFVDPHSSPEFRADVEAWITRPSDAAFVDAYRADPAVSIVDVTADDPAQYRVLSYAEGLRRALGMDKTGEPFSTNHNATYSQAVQADFRAVKETGAPSCRDVLWQFWAPHGHRLFRNVALPCLDVGIIVSKAELVAYRPGAIARPPE